MFERLFRPFLRSGGTAHPRPPDGTRLYVIGDIHGRLDLLREMQALLLADAAKRACERRVVVYLGDYIDRGPDSRAVIDHLVATSLPGFEPVFLRGNHEQVLLEFLNGDDIGPIWLDVGGGPTFVSYGVAPPSWGSDAPAINRAREELKAAIPPDHLAFLGSLRLWHAEGDYLMVHAGLRPGIELDRQAERDLLWIREPFLEFQDSFGAVVVHGHTITRDPERRPNRIGIDTGAFRSGTLTCYVAEGEEGCFIQTGRDPT